jgi:hypothetical protein
MEGVHCQAVRIQASDNKDDQCTSRACIETVFQLLGSTPQRDEAGKTPLCKFLRKGNNIK